MISQFKIFFKITYKSQFHLVTLGNVGLNTHLFNSYKSLTLCELFISFQYETGVLQTPP
jgi:hypothetical protein